MARMCSTQKAEEKETPSGNTKVRVNRKQQIGIAQMMTPSFGPIDSDRPKRKQTPNQPRRICSLAFPIRTSKRQSLGESTEGFFSLDVLLGKKISFHECLRSPSIEEEVVNSNAPKVSQTLYGYCVLSSPVNRRGSLYHSTQNALGVQILY